MGFVADSLTRADAAHVTRPMPKSAAAQMRYLVKQVKGTRAAAELLGVTQRTVERYVTGQLKHPRPALAERLAAEVRARWQPRVRDRARRQAATTGGIYVDTRARFGFTAAPGSTDDPRLRPITQGLPPAYAGRLFDAHAAGATEQQLQEIVAEGLQEIYFRDRGRRADGLMVEFTDIDYIDVDY
ncbi:telomere-protecting terminal protein Tpg [Streptomyces tropicalis]|uniref:XRE family transcriptional regulator n=1 Tax=Streptomyces tropicalis TaxID=3034234 RepID=A0ABT6A6I0_9ACTN|nr:XRE family transcriptional regulator [Streptomyces tropicalis]MDF3300244.1 XRE family transcriptional regulator [Streptomyces tropicalis]